MSGRRIAPGSGTLTYLTKRFPRLSETFILDEIIGLERAGLPLRLVSIADPGEPLRQARTAEVKSAVTYLHRPGGARAKAASWSTMAFALVELAIRRPRGVAGVLRGLRDRESAATAAKHLLEAAYLARVAEESGSRHIHAAFAHSPAAIAELASTLIGVPFSFAAHAKDLYLANPRHLAHRIERAAFVMVCSASARDALLQVAATHLGAQRSAALAGRVRLQYHGVDIERFAPPAGARRASGPPVILAVGRLVPKKGYPVLIDALAELAAQGAEFRCRVVGGGGMREELEARIRSAGLAGKVRLLGARTQEEVREEYTKADVFVQASVVVEGGDRDGVPNSVLEAMASAIPVVGTDVAGIPEVLLDGETGLVVPAGDPAALATAIGALLSDSDLRGRIGGAGRRKVERQLARDECSRAVAQRFWELAFAPGAPAGFAAVAPRTTWEAI